MVVVRASATLFVLAAVLCGPAGASAGQGPPPADLPSGVCNEAWRAPEVAVNFGDVAERPYAGFRLSAMFDAARAHEASFGDGYIRDRRNVLRASFVFTRRTEQRADELRAITAYPDNVRVLEACYSIRALERIQDVISRELLHTRRPVLRLRSDLEYSSIDVKLNQVEIGLEHYSESDEQKIVRRYGPVVRVFPGDVDISPDSGT